VILTHLGCVYVNDSHSFIAVNAQAVAANRVCDTCPEDPDSFLTLLERSVSEDAVSANAYYSAIDPAGRKTTIADWYFEAGFINTPAKYKSSGAMQLNDGSTVVVHQNVADLGSVLRAWRGQDVWRPRHDSNDTIYPNASKNHYHLL
jgi:hypothetical protein